MLTVSFMGSVAEKRASVTGAIRMNTGAPRQRRAAVHVPLPSPWGPPLEQQPSALRRHLPPVAHVHRFRSRITIITRQQRMCELPRVPAIECISLVNTFRISTRTSPPAVIAQAKSARCWAHSQRLTDAAHGVKCLSGVHRRTFHHQLMRRLVP